MYNLKLKMNNLFKNVQILIKSVSKLKKKNEITCFYLEHISSFFELKNKNVNVRFKISIVI